MLLQKFRRQLVQICDWWVDWLINRTELEALKPRVPENGFVRATEMNKTGELASEECEVTPWRQFFKRIFAPTGKVGAYARVGFGSVRA
jgi:hypothetical protein